MSDVIHVGNILHRQLESQHSMMTLEFSEAFSAKVTTSPPKPKSTTGFRTAAFLVKDTPGIPGTK